MPSVATAEVAVATAKARKHVQATSRKGSPRLAPHRGTVRPADGSVPAPDLKRLDKAYAIRMWNFRSPSQADTLLGDVGGQRTTLDHLGIGFI